MLFCIVQVCFWQLSFSQNADSLKTALKNAKHDTTRCVILSKLVEVEERNEMVWDSLNKKIEEISERNLKSQNLKPLEKQFYLKYLAGAVNNFGEYSERQGRVVEALEFYSKALKLREQVNDKFGIANSLYSLSSVYKQQGDDDKALEYLLRALKLLEEINDKVGLGHTLNNIGLIYNHKKDYEKATEYLGKSLKIREEIGDKNGIAISLNNIGIVYEAKGDQAKAIELYSQSLEICKQIGNMRGFCYSSRNIAKLHFDRKNYGKALEVATEGLNVAKMGGSIYNVMQLSELLSRIYKVKGDSKNALSSYELYIAMRDSVTNEETQKAAVKSQLKYEFEKKALADSLKTAEEKRITDVQLKQEKTQRYALYGGLVLVLVFAGFMFNRFKVTQKQKLIIEVKEKETQQQNVIISHQKELVEHQKHIVEEKHKEITDSINYAERIQRSFMATKELLDENLNAPLQGSTTKQSHTTNEIASPLSGAHHDESNYFVFFKPKDVVSGDFYWAAEVSGSRFEVPGYENREQEMGNQKLFYLATADSTGHGVPGAIMSLLNITSLEKAIEKYANPSEILNATRQTIIERLKKDGSAEGGKDGMDCSLLVFDFTNKKLLIAAAHNPVWIVRSTVTSSTDEGGVSRSDTKGSRYEQSSTRTDKHLIDIKPDKMPVGKHDRDQESFTLHAIDLQKGDVIYTLTDGFPDQFGGPKGKKFMSKNLKELLLANAHLPMSSQKQLLEKTFHDWVNGLEQVDDVTIIGIRV